MDIARVSGPLSGTEGVFSEEPCPSSAVVDVSGATSRRCGRKCRLSPSEGTGSTGMSVLGCGKSCIKEESFADSSPNTLQETDSSYIRSSSEFSMELIGGWRLYREGRSGGTEAEAAIKQTSLLFF